MQFLQFLKSQIGGLLQFDKLEAKKNEYFFLTQLGLKKLGPKLGMGN